MDRFDVAVLGGGVAGCVLASRLSEDPGTRVLLVEAGPDHGADVDNWPQEVRDPRALPRGPLWERGVAAHRFRARLLGGSSCVNGCWNTWGSAADHAEWVDRIAPWWSEDALEPDRRRAVEQMALQEVPDDELSEWSAATLQAMADVGYTRVDMGRSGGPGAGSPLLNARDGLRWNAALAYLPKPVRARANLTILAGGLVDRLVLRSGRVVGVQVLRAGAGLLATAGQYVLACGTIGSPAVLQRSGIGPAAHLQQVGIEPVLDLPGVGAGLADHPGVFVPLRPTPALDAALVRRQEQGGLFTSRALLRADSGASAQGGWDLHLLPTAGVPLFGSLPPGRFEAGISAFVVKPVSRGHVRVRSATADDPPCVDPGFLTDRDGHDVAVLRRGLRIVGELADTDAVAWRTRDDGHEVAEQLAMAPAERLRDLAGPYWHPTGTCAMGRPNTTETVVDPSAHVLGVANLLVADASVLPTPPAANTQLTVLALAERLARTMLATEGP